MGAQRRAPRRVIMPSLSGSPLSKRASRSRLPLGRACPVASLEMDELWPARSRGPNSYGASLKNRLYVLRGGLTFALLAGGRRCANPWAGLMAAEATKLQRTHGLKRPRSGKKRSACRCSGERTPAPGASERRRAWRAWTALDTSRSRLRECKGPAGPSVRRVSHVKRSCTHAGGREPPRARSTLLLSLQPAPCWGV